MAKINLFRVIDEFLFDKIDELQTISEYQKFVESYSNLEENLQEWIKMGLMLLITIVPIMIYFVFSGSNKSKNEELRLKEEIIKIANELIHNKSVVSIEEKKILGLTFIDSRNDLTDKMTTLLLSASIDTSKISIRNFDSEEMDGLITKVKSDLQFKDLTSEDIYAIINNLSTKGKMKIDEISIRKSPTDNLLSGTMSILHYSKEATSK